jgi:hypothetical protein
MLQVYIKVTSIYFDDKILVKRINELDANS